MSTMTFSVKYFFGNTLFYSVLVACYMKLLR